MCDMETVGPGYLHHQYTADTNDIRPLDDDQPNGDIPQFMFPWTRKEHHEENPVHPLLQAGTFRCDDDSSPTTFAVCSSQQSRRGNRCQIDVENMVEHPTCLAIQHID